MVGHDPASGSAGVVSACGPCCRSRWRLPGDLAPWRAGAGSSAVAAASRSCVCSRGCADSAVAPGSAVTSRACPVPGWWRPLPGSAAWRDTGRAGSLAGPGGSAWPSWRAAEAGALRLAGSHAAGSPTGDGSEGCPSAWAGAAIWSSSSSIWRARSRAAASWPACGNGLPMLSRACAISRLGAADVGQGAGLAFSSRARRFSSRVISPTGSALAEFLLRTGRMLVPGAPSRLRVMLVVPSDAPVHVRGDREAAEVPGCRRARAQCRPARPPPVAAGCP